MKRLKTRELVLEVRELLFVLDGDKRVGMFDEFFVFLSKVFVKKLERRSNAQVPDSQSMEEMSINIFDLIFIRIAVVRCEISRGVKRD